MSYRRGRHQRYIVVLLTLVIALTVATTAYGYTVRPNKTSPYSWQYAETYYYLTNSFVSRNSGWDDSILAAATNWNDVSNDPFYFGRDSYANHEVNSGCPSYFDKSYSDGDGITLANTAIAWNTSTKRYTDFTMTISNCVITGGPHPNSPIPFYDGTQASSLPSNYMDLKTTLRHELGHVQGVCHTASPTSALMYYNQNYGQLKNIDTDAANGSRWIYNRSAATSNPEQENCRG